MLAGVLCKNHTLLSCILSTMRRRLLRAQELRLAALPSATSGDARAWQIFGCSAISSEGLLDGFDWLVKDVGSRLYLLA